MADFDEVRFPSDISRGSAGGPERRTDIVTLGSGFEERNASWFHSRRRYDAALGLRSIDDLQEVIAFFEARNGRLIGFRWKDWVDYRSGAPKTSPAATDQVIGAGTGSDTEFQLKKTYSTPGSSREYVRDITKPVANTVLIAIDGVELSEGADYSVDTTTGLVTLTVAPAASTSVTAGYEFDVPARFDSDYIAVSVDAFEAGSLPQLDIIEVRV